MIYGCSIITYTLHRCKESVLWDCINLQHQFGAAWYKVRRRRPKYISERGNEEIESTLGNVQPFAIDVKGGGKTSNRR